MSVRVERRAVVALLAGAAVALPFVAHGQHPPEIGFLDTRSLDALASRLRAFRQGLKDTGYVDGENLTIIHRGDGDQYGRLPEHAAELVRRRVALIFAGGGAGPALAAKAATATIPIVFAVPDDPVKLGLVASVARPGGNLTGVNFLTTELVAKRLELLRDLVPAARRVAVLVNPANFNAEPTLRDAEAGARAMGLALQPFNASTGREIEAAFATMARERPDALFVGGDSLFISRRVQLVNLTVRHAIPAAFSARDFAEAGGLLSYTSNILDAYRQVGVYAGRILKGARPADLPVVQSTKFELVINQQTARMLGVTVPSTLLSIADEVID